MLTQLLCIVKVPEMFKSEEQQAIDALSVYQRPLVDLRRSLNSMEEPLEFEEKGLVVRTVQTYFSPSQKPSLLFDLDRLGKALVFSWPKNKYKFVECLVEHQANQ